MRRRYFLPTLFLTPLLTLPLLAGCQEAPEAPAPEAALTSAPRTTPPPALLERERARAMERQTAKRPAAADTP